MKKHILSLSFIFSIATSINAQDLSSKTSSFQCQNPPVQSCSFYRKCLERSYPCGNKGYALSYGEKYCYRFLAIEKKLSSEGKLFNQLTRNCLQKKLIPLLDIQAFQKILPQAPRCEDILDFAFDSHPECYTEHDHSICFLNPITDLPIILKQFKAKDMMTKKSFIQMAQVTSACLVKISEKIFEVLPLGYSDPDLLLAENEHKSYLKQQLSFWQQEQDKINSELEKANLENE